MENLERLKNDFSLSFFKDKTVFVTGHTGFKGSWLSEILLNSGARVVGYSLPAPTDPNLFDILGLKDRLINVEGDIRDFKLLLETITKFKPDIVIHLAAQPIVLNGYKDPLYTYETNVIGTVNLLEAVRRVGCVRSFLNVTTDKVYENNDIKNHRFAENEKLDGFDPYSNSKSCSELVTHCYYRSFFYNTNTAVSTARAGNVIGGGDFSPDRIIPDCIRFTEKKQDILVRNRFSTRPYQFVLEPLFVYLLIAEFQFQDKKYSGYYNVGPDNVDAITTGDLVDLFCSKWGSDAKWVDKTVAGAPHEAGYLALDNSMIKNIFGWKPVCHVDEAIDDIVKWTKGYLSKGDFVARQIIDEEISDFSKRFLK
jgi:CDP-glucose 4,6-dehydratase